MNALYLDASVVLRFLFRQPGFVDLRQAEAAVASALTGVECLRTLDRARLQGRAEAGELQRRHAILREVLARLEVVTITPSLLLRASAPMPSPLGTLDAVHLVSALQWRELHNVGLVFATHDVALARAARMHGLDVAGVDVV